jgi:hypothetical protein
MLIPPGEAKRPYVPPVVIVHRVELEKSIVADGSPVQESIPVSPSSLSSWGEEIQLDEGGDIEMSW